MEKIKFIHVIIFHYRNIFRKKPKKIWKIEKIQFIHGFILHYRNIFLRNNKKTKNERWKKFNLITDLFYCSLYGMLSKENAEKWKMEKNWFTYGSRQDTWPPTPTRPLQPTWANG